jgi:plastocyanin
VSTPFATSTPLPAASGAPVTTPTPVTQLRLQDFSFAPPTVTTTVGTKLTWTNAGPSNHTVTANDGSFDSGPIQLNGSFSFTPTKPGTYAYRCTIHPTMSGTLVVRAPAAA